MQKNAATSGDLERAINDLREAREQCESASKQRRALQDDMDALKYDMYTTISKSLALLNQNQNHQPNTNTNSNTSETTPSSKLKPNNNSNSKQQTLPSLFEFEQCSLSAYVGELMSSIDERCILLASLGQELDDKRAEMDALRAYAANYVKQFKQQMHSHECELTALKSKQEHADDECKQARLRLDALDDEQRARQRQLSEVRAKCEAADKELSATVARRDTETHALDKLKARLDEKKAELDEIEAQCQSGVHHLDELQRNQLELMQEIERLDNAMCSEKKRVDASRSHADELQAKCAEANGKLKAKLDEVARGEHALAKLAHALADKQAAIKREQERLVDVLQQKSEASAEHAAIRDTLKSKQVELDKLAESVRLGDEKLAGVKSEASALNERLAQTRSQMSMASIKLGEMNAKMQTKQVVLDQIAMRIGEKKMELDNLMACLDECKSRYQSEKRQLADLQVILWTIFNLQQN